MNINQSISVYIYININTRDIGSVRPIHKDQGAQHLEHSMLVFNSSIVDWNKETKEGFVGVQADPAGCIWDLSDVSTVAKPANDHNYKLG